ncbi:DegT/DnrJ/EryC1/StrS family aminotransferase [Cytobacillus stercorigallinarum]|uniref:DegT/DnrJ/EryC1/StrS family aminotransferase n=1 Tax=Cytobacillus stercorigallinarum TaxID=2762240 RepID=UPI00296ADAD9|nr:aminotransferase class I/II-fold pyridoxal phosphate-dependent enzyme [Cytobacillus stercorigallinarum]
MTLAERIYLSPPHLTGEEIHYVQSAFTDNWVAPVGPHIDLFEQEMSTLVNVRSCLAVNSGTAAIHLSLLALGIGSLDTVFCSTFTFVATANPILYIGAKPVFIDSEPETWNMSPDALERALKEADANGHLPKAVIVVHLYGQPAKMDELIKICQRYGVPLIEDAAESLGSTYKEKPTGTIGSYGIYSFNGNKIITTSGGGMLVSNHKEGVEYASFLATQAKDQALHYQHSQIGFNYRMSNIAAGIGRAQLTYLDNRIDARRKIYERYEKGLQGLAGISFIPELPGTYSNRWLTTILIDSETIGVTVEELIFALRNENIEARPVWKPLHLQPLFQDYSFYPHDVECGSISEMIFEKGICLPSGSNLTIEQQNRVIHCIRNTIISNLHLHPYLLG